MVELSKVIINYETSDIVLTEIEQLGWQIRTRQNNVYQKEYCVQIARNEDFEKIVYNSGSVKTDVSMNIKISKDELTLESAQKYYLRVKVTTNVGESDWKVVTFFTGLIQPEKWKASFITIETGKEKDESKGFYLRKEFSARKKIKSAFVLSTALGLYRITINGNRVGDDVLTPGWTSYNKHLLYQMYDVTECINDKNTVGVLVGAGWYKGVMGFARQRNHYGTKAAFSCQIHIEYEDGSLEVIKTDESWQGEWSPIIFSEIYDGEIYDAKLEIENWNKTQCEYKAWREVDKVEFNTKALRVQTGCRIKEITKVKPKEIIITNKKECVLDFGQNMTGWVKFKAKGQRNKKIVLKFFEVLDRNGNVYLDNLRSAKQTITYVCKDNQDIVFCPSFTFQGFRYMQIISYVGKPELENFTAYAVHSNMEETGTFECSNRDVNQLQHNIKWGMKGNFLDIPTDCPQRDERLGWTGDAQIFARTASYIMSTNTFFRKWLRDLKVDQTEDGGVPHVIPDILIGKSGKDRLLQNGEHSAAAWADAAVIIPWTMYLVYGDKNVIIEQYESMKKWIEFMKAHSNDFIWNYKLQFGDWVALDAEEGSYFGATPNDLTCTAFFAYSTCLFAKMAKIIGCEEDYRVYKALYKKIVDKYQHQFLDCNGHMKVKTQTAQIISLYFNLVPEEYKPNVAKDLVELLEKEGGHLVTGFVGTPYFCHVLSQNGYTEEAYNLLLKEDFPSWLYQVKAGATTIWEHWDGKKPDGTMWSADMNSFNHYAYGAIGDWLYRCVAGIDVDEEKPGYKHIYISPEICSHLSYVRGVFKSIYGDIVSQWERKEDEVTLSVEIPANTTGEIQLKQVREIVASGGLDFKNDGAKYVSKIKSGYYVIKYKCKQKEDLL